jgi:1-acyl-sn-glycerol-3-phosphate acyltransferase
MKRKILSLIHLIWYKFAQTVAVVFVRCLYHVKVHGKENIPRTGPLLILSSHQSFFDPMFCQNFILRPFTFIARDTLWETFIARMALNSFYVIPIRRGEADISAMRKAIDVLKQDSALVIYPEATRTSDGRVARIRPGIDLIIRRSSSTVVPMAIEGAFEAWPKTKKLPRPYKKIVVRYGKPISPDQVKEMGPEKFAKYLTDTIRSLQNESRVEMGREPFDYSHQEDDEDTKPNLKQDAQTAKEEESGASQAGPADVNRPTSVTEEPTDESTRC